MFILQILLLLFKNKCFLAKKPVMGVLPSFINMQTCHGSFCHLLWANKPTMGVFAIFYKQTNLL
jgi:hypothetical protein